MQNFNKAKTVIQIRTINVLKKWLESQRHVFEEKSLLRLLQKFIERLSKAGGTEKQYGEMLGRALIGSYGEDHQNENFDGAPKPLLPSNLIPRTIRFLDLHPKEVARQMTLLFFEDFKNSTPDQFINKLWTEKEKMTPIRSLVENFNKLTFWVATEILLAKEEKRTLTIQRFLEVLENLKDLNNFHGMMIVYCALTMNYIKNLDAWKEVSSKQSAIIKLLDTLMDPVHNYKNYCEYLRQVTPPAIPFQAVYMTQLTFVDEIPTNLANGMINFEKMNILSKILGEIQQFQKIPYKLIPVPYIHSYWDNVIVLDDDELYNMAKEFRVRKGSK